MSNNGVDVYLNEELADGIYIVKVYTAEYHLFQKQY